MTKPELLAPAGDLEKLKMAVLYGADAVYIGGESFGLRTASKNFDRAQMEEGIRFAHERNVKVYVTVNIIPHNEQLSAFPAYLDMLCEVGADAVIVADLGLFSMVRKLHPEMSVHVSTQANNVNYETVRTWHELGAERVVLARELSFDEIHEIREKTDPA